MDDTPSTAFSFGAALIPILFAYGGWQVANYVAEEMRDPERHLPRSLILGTLTVVVIYLLVNVAYLRTLGLEGLAATMTPAADAAGAGWAQAASASLPRPSRFRRSGFSTSPSSRPRASTTRWRPTAPSCRRSRSSIPRYGTPGAAIVLQSAWAIVLALTGEYGDLLDTVVFADWIFFGLTVAGLFVLRPRLARLGMTTGYRTPGYPWLPALFVAVAAVVVYSAIQEAPLRSAVGAGLLFAGIPVFYLFKWWTSRGGSRT